MLYYCKYVLCFKVNICALTLQLHWSVHFIPSCWCNSDVLTEAVQAVGVPFDDAHRNFFLKEVLHLCVCEGMVFYLGLPLKLQSLKENFSQKWNNKYFSYHRCSRLAQTCLFSDVCLARPWKSLMLPVLQTVCVNYILFLIFFFFLLNYSIYSLTV